MLKKISKYQLLELFCIFIITLVFNLVFNDVSGDEIWNYGFAYNIASGLIPYKDFNMVITPLYPIINGIFMVIFSKSIITMHIINAIICTAIFYCMKQLIPKAYYIPYSFFLFFSLPNYNVLCFLFLYILIIMEHKKDNDYLIGIIIGLTFLTKQNIGLYLCIPTIFTNDIKKIIKRIIGFIIPNIILLIYLLHNNAFHYFFDYCFLGINEFAKKNYVSYISTLCPLIICIIYLIYKYIKNKDIAIIYILSFSLISYPIFDSYHTSFTLILTLGYFVNNLNLNKRIISYTFILFIIFISLFNYFKYYKNEYKYPNNTNAYKYRKINENTSNNINILTNYFISTKENIFIINGTSYLIKLNIPITTNKYDLLFNGNMGKNGDIKIIKEFQKLCNKEKCTFLLDKNAKENDEYNQYNHRINDYIISNYHEDDNLIGLTIYKNYKSN